jgi:enoyl-CoA hydratase/carnithine racemase
MLEEIRGTLALAAENLEIAAVILTGMGKYYCAGVDFAGQLALDFPSSLKKMAEESNYELFDLFISFPKPIFAAVNGPAIGASVTSAVLCDMVIANDAATFHTPFKALGITPEGCSSINFPRLMGTEGTKMMLDEGKKIDADEALRLGLIGEVVQNGSADNGNGSQLSEVISSALVQRSLEIAQKWVNEGRPRLCIDHGLVEQLREVNRFESKQLAESFFKPPFLQAQYEFAKKKNKTAPMWVFWFMNKLHPLLSKL